MSIPTDKTPDRHAQYVAAIVETLDASTHYDPRSRSRDRGEGRVFDTLALANELAEVLVILFGDGSPPPTGILHAHCVEVRTDESFLSAWQAIPRVVWVLALIGVGLHALGIHGWGAFALGAGAGISGFCGLSSRVV
jgi:hypothetical protein